MTGADPSVGGSAGEDSGEGNFAVGVSVLPLEAALSEMESEDRGLSLIHISSERIPPITIRTVC